MENDSGDREGQAQQPPAKLVNIQKIYLKDASLEAPATPQVFNEEWNPDADVQIGTSAQAISDGLHEVVLTVTVTTRVGDSTAFLVEIKQGGVFGVEGFEVDELGAVLGSFCPSVLFPYAREAISDMVAKAGFPQLLLQPVNFDALYAEHMRQRKAEAH